MKIFGTLSVFDGQIQSGDTALVVTTEIFDALTKVIKQNCDSDRFSFGESRDGRWFQFEYEISETIAKSIFRLIRDLDGRVPSLSVAREPNKGEFHQPLRQAYSSKELDEFDYFTFFSNQFIATMGCRDRRGGEISVKKDSRLGKMLSIGDIFPSGAVGVSSEMADLMKPYNGTNLMPIPFEGSRKFSGIHLLSSSIELPDTILDKLNIFGQIYSDDGKGCLFDGGPFTVPELMYEISMLPSFDIAVTREYIGLSENDRFQVLVISRKVRSEFKRNKLNRINYYPVRLISSSDSRSLNPWKGVFNE